MKRLLQTLALGIFCLPLLLPSNTAQAGAVFTRIDRAALETWAQSQMDGCQSLQGRINASSRWTWKRVRPFAKGPSFLMPYSPDWKIDGYPLVEYDWETAGTYEFGPYHVGDGCTLMREYTMSFLAPTRFTALKKAAPKEDLVSFRVGSYDAFVYREAEFCEQDTLVVRMPKQTVVLAKPCQLFNLNDLRIVSSLKP
jgi:hypothetical protein